MQRVEISKIHLNDVQNDLEIYFNLLMENQIYINNSIKLIFITCRDLQLKKPLKFRRRYLQMLLIY